MKLNAVAVTTTDINKSVSFYKIIGFKFLEYKSDDKHVESISNDGIKLMIDTDVMMESILGTKPMPANHSHFAIEYDSPEKVNEIVNKLQKLEYEIYKEPWDAFWGQRYAIVKDPGGYLVDLYATLPT